VIHIKWSPGGGGGGGGPRRPPASLLEPCPGRTALINTEFQVITRNEEFQVASKYVHRYIGTWLGAVI